ncbi:MAG: hydroxyacid dehydrogenase [Defluviitaleaceae bacterium]|nr:hydroxyacid dehydrogenase [Defluviitaleaceae bacterium]
MNFNIALLMPDDLTRAWFAPPDVIAVFAELGNLRVNDRKDYEPQHMAALLTDCHVCITGWGCPALDADVLKNAPDLRLVIHTGGTVAGIVTDELYNRGVRVISGNEIFAQSVAEGTLAYMLAALRRIPFYNKLMHEGGWKRGIDKTNAGLFNKSVGLIGFGAIPRYLVPMLKLFTTDICVYDPYVADSVLQEFEIKRAESLADVFSKQLISNHLPLTKETEKLIDADLLGLMRENAVFINTARGGTVDEDALIAVLKKGKITAVLDVFEVEPLPADSQLMGLDNAILIPHMAGPTADRYIHVSLSLAAVCKDYLQGKPLMYEVTHDYASRMTSIALQKM